MSEKKLYTIMGIAVDKEELAELFDLTHSEGWSRFEAILRHQEGILARACLASPERMDENQRRNGEARMIQKLLVLAEHTKEALTAK